MKTTTIGIVAGAILMVVAAVGFGIAQAGGIHTDHQGVSTEDQAIPQEAEAQTDGIQLASEGQEFVPEDNWSGTDWQAREPVETGAIPVRVSEEPWMKDYGSD